MNGRRSVRAAGGRPHILNDNPMFDVASALAYLDTTLELLDQMKVAIRSRPRSICRPAARVRQAWCWAGA